MAQLVGASSHNRKVVGLISGQGADLGCRSDPWSKSGHLLSLVQATYKRQPTDASVSHCCCSVSLPLSLKAMKKCPRVRIKKNVTQDPLNWYLEVTTHSWNVKLHFTKGGFWLSNRMWLHERICLKCLAYADLHLHQLGLRNIKSFKSVSHQWSRISEVALSHPTHAPIIKKDNSSLFHPWNVAAVFLRAWPPFTHTSLRALTTEAGSWYSLRPISLDSWEVGSEICILNILSSLEISTLTKLWGALEKFAKTGDMSVWDVNYTEHWKWIWKLKFLYCENRMSEGNFFSTLYAP